MSNRMSLEQLRIYRTPHRWKLKFGSPKFWEKFQLSVEAYILNFTRIYKLPILIKDQVLIKERNT